MKCPKCKHENDEDAAFCENCGSKIKNPSSDKIFTNEPPKEGLAQSTKILLVICVVLVIGVGIASGILIKSSQQTSPDQSATNTSNQITTSTGFPISQASNLAVQISKYNGNFESITYGSITLNKNQVLYILAKAIVMINSNEQGNIPIKSIQSPSSPEGTVTSATIAQSDYVSIASRTYTWADKYGRTPNYVGITNPGQPDLSPTTTLNLFTKILSQYNSTGQLPTSVTIP
jgi:Double zinc ribbon